MAIGAVFFVLVFAGVPGGCRTTPELPDVQTPPVTTIRHYDTAFSLIHGAPVGEIAPVYATIARLLLSLAEDGGEDAAVIAARAENVGRRLDALIRTAEGSSPETLLTWTRMWHQLADLNDGFTSHASTTSREALSRVAATEHESDHADFLVRLLDAQLSNSNVEEETVRRSLDGLYLLGDDTVRATALVRAAELIRARDDRLALNPVVQQAIAVVPVVQSPTTAMLLNARLSDLSRSLGNERDVAVLKDQAIRRAETGLLLVEREIDDLQWVLEFFVSRGDRPGAEVIVENIAPVSSRAVGYAMLGFATGRWDRRLPYEEYFEVATEIAFSIDDPGVRVQTMARIILLRVESDPGWNPNSVIADLLGGVPVARVTREARVEMLSTLYFALVRADRSEDTTRLRGLIRSADELSLINLAVAERLLASGSPATAREWVSRIERSPMPDPGAPETPAYRIARVWVALEEYDRSISVLHDAEPREQARVLSGIPADHQPNPAAVTDLERLLR